MVNRNLLFIGIGLILVYFFFAGGIGSFGNEDKQKVICDVVIDNFIGSPGIEEVTCHIESSCGFFTALPLSIFGEQVTVQLQAGGKKDSKSVSVSNIPFKDKTVTLSVCIDDAVSIGEIRLLDDTGDLIESQNIGF